MRWDEDQWAWILTSGRVLRCKGFDAVLSVAEGIAYQYADDVRDGPFTAEEKREIAEYQIALWRAWAKDRNEAHEQRAQAERAAEPSPLRGPEWPHLEVR